MKKKQQTPDLSTFLGGFLDDTAPWPPADRGTPGSGQVGFMRNGVMIWRPAEVEVERVRLVSSLPPLATPPDTRPTLTAYPVVTVDDALLMAYIRNAGRHGFSGDNSIITDDQQREWWARMRQRVVAWLFYDDAGALVGYGAIRQDEDGRWASTVAVLPEHTGHGYGGAITRYVVEHTDVPIWARANIGNFAAQKLHNLAQWEVTAVDDQHVFFATKPRVREG